MNRRAWLKRASLALASIPIVVYSELAAARTNEPLRAQLGYQDTPKGDKSCANCLEFIPGSASADAGGCKVIPGDDQISPNGYCTLWNTM